MKFSISIINIFSFHMIQDTRKSIKFEKKNKYITNLIFNNSAKFLYEKL